MQNERMIRVNKNSFKEKIKKDDKIGIRDNNTQK